jgi:hypothetical protein
VEGRKERHILVQKEYNDLSHSQLNRVTDGAGLSFLNPAELMASRKRPWQGYKAPAAKLLSFQCLCPSDNIFQTLV